MKTILEVIKLGEEYLKKRGIERARREAEELISEVLGISRIALYLDFERPLQENELEKCRHFFKRRSLNEPPQYIFGYVFFAGVHIKVNSDVLIPRPETELLVSKIIKDLETENLKGKILWDMCTGSGCIGISLKKRFPELRVILSDISEKALSVASQNAQANGVEVEIVQSDMFSAVGDFSFHYFVSNPPYVSIEEYHQLEPKITQFEPQLAFLAGSKGLFFYEEIAKHLFFFLKERAWLEIGSNQGPDVMSLFNQFKSSLEKDWSGKDRFLKLEKF